MGFLFESDKETLESGTRLPAHIEDAAKKSVSLIDSASQQPFRRFSSDNYDKTIDMVRDSEGIWKDRTDAAGDIYGGVADFMPSPVQAGQIGEADLEPYMNPYLQNVLSRQLDEMDRRAAIDLNQIDANMTGGEAFGGSRHGIVESEYRRNYGDERRDATERGYYNAFANALGLAGDDIDRRYAADTFNEGMKLSGEQLRLGAGDAMAGLGQLEAGLAKQDTDQRRALADFDYREFLREFNYPFDVANFRTAALSGLPYGVTQFQEQLGPSPLAQIAGAGATAASFAI